MTRKAGVFALAAVALFSGAAVAQEETNRVGAERDWSIFQGDDPKECWAVTAPKETVNTRDGRVVSVRRGDILLFVTYRSGHQMPGEVSFTGGYTFADNSIVTLEVGGTTFNLGVSGEYAWPEKKDDKSIVDALKQGATAIVTGRSSRGTITKDTFSLLGATTMIEEAEKRCAE